MVLVGALILIVFASFVVNLIVEILELLVVIVAILLVLGGIALIVGGRWWRGRRWEWGPPSAST